jgi:hypothetical protein
MLKAPSCTASGIISFSDAEEIAALPWRPESFRRCPDCGVAPNGFHHTNCDQEKCPRCGGQFIVCQIVGCGFLDNNESLENEANKPLAHKGARQ